MISESITFLSVFWLELIALSVPTLAFIVLVTVFDYWRLIELKYAGAVALATVIVALYSLHLWETHVWRAFLYAFGAMYLAAGVWVLVLILIHFSVERYRNSR